MWDIGGDERNIYDIVIIFEVVILSLFLMILKTKILMFNNDFMI